MPASLPDLLALVILRWEGLVILLIFPHGKTAGFWAFSSRSGLPPPICRDFVFLVNYLVETADTYLQAANTSYH